MKSRVLCLHGHRQSAAKLKGEMAALLRAAKASTEFVFVNGPFEVPYEPTSEEHIQRVNEMTQEEQEDLKQSVEQFAWWNFERHEDTGAYSYIGIEHALEYLENVIKTQGPFDGVFGFSQGGICAAYMLALQTQGDARFQFKYGAFCASALMTDPKYKIVFDTPMQFPSLHIMGEQDELITIARSRELAAQFQDAVELPHPGGHYIPTQKDPRTIWKTFFEDQSKSTEN